MLVATARCTLGWENVEYPSPHTFVQQPLASSQQTAQYRENPSWLEYSGFSPSS